MSRTVTIQSKITDSSIVKKTLEKFGSLTDFRFSENEYYISFQMPLLDENDKFYGRKVHVNIRKESGTVEMRDFSGQQYVRRFQLAYDMLRTEQEMAKLGGYAVFQKSHASGAREIVYNLP